MSQGMLTTMLFTNGSVVHVLIELMIINLLLEEHRNRSGLFEIACQIKIGLYTFTMQSVSFH